MKNTAVIRKAVPDDINAIYDIIKSYSNDGVILERSHGNIKLSLSDFHVAELNHAIAGVISHFDYGTHLKEIRSLGVKKNFLRRGIGSALLMKVIQDLCRQNKPKIFVLTYTPEFFERNGFSVIQKDTLPEKIWKDCSKCKNIDICSEIALEYQCTLKET